MLRVLKIACVTSALAALCFVTTNCGNGGSAKVRVVNVVSNNEQTAGLDVYVNGSRIITAVAYGAYSPSQTTPAAYLGVTSGSDMILAFNTGQTTNPIIGTGSIGNANSGPTVNMTTASHTLLLAGQYLNSTNPPAPYLFTDVTTPPVTGNVQFRVINGSTWSASQFSQGLIIYILPAGTQIIPGVTPATISGLTLGSAGTGNGYITLPNINPTQYTVSIYGSQTRYYSFSYSPVNQQVTTLVIQDNPGGNGIETLIYSDDVN